MQIKTVVLSFFVAAATAQSLQELVASVPKCAQPCIQKAAATVGCGVTDLVCQCNKVEELTAAGTQCVATSCTEVSDLTATFEISAKICAAVAAGAVGDAVSSKVSSATAAIGAATSSLGNLVPSATPTKSTTSTPSATPAGAIRNGAALGLAAAAVVMAL